MAGVLAVSDQKNVAPPAWLTGPLVGLLVVGIGMAFGFNAGYAINPARDFGPRLFTAVAGWGGGVFTASNGWWWVPVVAPIVGAVLGILYINKREGSPTALLMKGVAVSALVSAVLALPVTLAFDNMNAIDALLAGVLTTRDI